MLIVLESTTYPGSTKELILPYIAKNKNLIPGKIFVYVLVLRELTQGIKLTIPVIRQK